VCDLVLKGLESGGSIPGQLMTPGRVVHTHVPLSP